MTTNTTIPQSLQGHFLIATPYLGDPRFHGAVVYLCDHSSDGALGVMVNRPLDISLGEVLEQLDMDGGELNSPVFSGGPVEPERGFVLHEPAKTWQATTPISNDIMLTTSRDVLASIGEGEGPRRYRVALGYSGWGEGQLESELAGNAWLTCPASAELLFGPDWENLYSAVLTKLGIDINQLSDSIGHA